MKIGHAQWPARVVASKSATTGTATESAGDTISRWRARELQNTVADERVPQEMRTLLAVDYQQAAMLDCSNTGISTSRFRPRQSRQIRCESPCWVNSVSAPARLHGGTV